MKRAYVNFICMTREHQAQGEWMDTWRVELNPDGRTEGFSFHLVGCPIAKHAKVHGYGDLLPYLCRTDHYLAERQQGLRGFTRSRLPIASYITAGTPRPPRQNQCACRW